MGALLLLLLVILNAFATGWLLATVKRMRKTLQTMAKVQRDVSRSQRVQYLYGTEDDAEALDALESLERV